MENIKKQLVDKQQELRIARKKKAELTEELESAQIELALAKDVIQVFQKAARVSQDTLAAHLSNIVTKAVQAVIQKPYEFVCEFVERRGATEADLYLTKDGNRYEILGGTGGGTADVCSAALKVAYLLLSNKSRVLVMDEISRHINSAEQRKRFAEVIKTFSTQFEIQFILVTTVSELLEISDEIIEIR